jgi:hypothetical protein
MTIKQLRARLGRLEQSAKLNDAKVEQRKLPFDFPIDPALAKAIRDDCRHLKELEGDRHELFMRRYIRCDPDPPEERAVQARIAEQAKTISCSPCYGFNEFWDDDRRLASLKTVKDADAEEAQVIARMEAFKQTPEGRARIRLDELESADRWRTAAEHEEIERLIKLYPEPWHDPKSRLLPYALSIRGTPEERKRKAERDRRAAEKAEALRRTQREQENKK